MPMTSQEVVAYFKQQVRDFISAKREVVLDTARTSFNSEQVAAQRLVELQQLHNDGSQAGTDNASKDAELADLKRQFETLQLTASLDKKSPSLRTLENASKDEDRAFLSTDHLKLQD